MNELALWEEQFAHFLDVQAAGDAAHDRAHIRRVVNNARALALVEGADLAVVIPAAWLHDCVTVPKDSPQRPQASQLSAAAGESYLRKAGYPRRHIAAISHAIAAHSFSANISPQSIEARVVQDADRLDAIGAVGIARCLMLGATLGRPLYDPVEPFPIHRPADDTVSSIDHFFTKLLRLEATMKTAAGRAEAARRSAFLRTFLIQLGEEIGVPAPR